MDKTFTDELVDEILSIRLPLTTEFQKCSFITPTGKYFIMDEHYEAFKFLVVEGLAPCIPDAELLLSDLGYVRFSWIGYLTLPNKELTSDQYKTLETTLMEIARLRDEICIQIFNNPRFYLNVSLEDIPNIIRKIKMFYKYGEMLP